MTNEAADEVAGSDTASPELVALVAKREQELKGKPSTPASTASKAKGPEDAAKGATGTGQAKEVEAERDDAEGAPDEGKPDDAKKPLDVEWAKSDALKRRISALHEAGHLDDDLLGLIRTGVERKAHLKAANDKFEAAADKVKAANAERDQYRERAERYDRLMADPKFHAALHAAESGDAGDDESLMTPEEKRIARLEKDLADMKAERADRENSEKSSAARIKEIEGWAEDHKSSLGDSVTPEAYESALKAVLTDLIEGEINPRTVLTQRGLVRLVNKELDRTRDAVEVAALRERADGSKRDVVRSARASSPAGVRTEVGTTYPNTPAGQRAKRVAETLAKYPLRPE